MREEIHGGLNASLENGTSREFVQQLIDQAGNEKKSLIVAINNISDPISEMIIDLLDKNTKTVPKILFKQAHNRKVPGDVQFCNLISEPFNFTCLVIVGNDSYFMAKSGEVAGWYNHQELTEHARSAINKVADIYINANL
jgi:hypothetical protein